MLDLSLKHGFFEICDKLGFALLGELFEELVDHDITFLDFIWVEN